MSNIPILGGASNISAKREQAEEMARRLIVDAALPVYSTNSGDPDHIGTAWVLEEGEEGQERRYLITAAHVVDECSSSGLYVAFDGCFIPIDADAWLTKAPGGDRDKDRYDVSVIPLDQLWDQYFTGMRPIKSALVRWGSSVVPGHLYCVYGYPNTKNKMRWRNTRVKATSVLHTDAAVDAPEVARKLPGKGEHHILIRYGKQVLDQGGRKTNSIRPKGMSGGPVVDLGRLSDPNILAGLEPLLPLVTAIVIEKDQAGPIITTKMSVVRTIIDNLIALYAKDMSQRDTI